eukprot:gb/GFBE01036504.1/.p1 GENE.gb/GFBE01036504.1/~~gb/GFBE01036504.1/.p1  ORF type:complete len:163 (+),score=27.70 gb/GFBE01036504.1/:1-489(+)
MAKRLLLLVMFQSWCASEPCARCPWKGLQSHTVDWEEDPVKLIELLDAPQKATAGTSLIDAWLGRHAARKSARTVYLLLARKWHPDKWVVQGERCVEVATEVAKKLVAAYDQACRELPNDTGPADYRQEEDEDRECYEFASWVGISFTGIEEVWAQRRRVKR